MRKKIIILSITIGFLVFASPSQALVKAIGFTSSATKTAIGVSTRVKLSANGNVYTKALNIGKASLGAVIKKRAFSPWGAAFVALLVAADYYLDETTGEVMFTAPPSGELGDCTAGNLQDVTINQCLAKSRELFPSANFQVEWSDAWNAYCMVDTNGTCGYVWFHPYIGDHPETSTEEIITDDEIADIVLPAVSNAVLPDVLTDPATGLPDEAITELTQAIQSLDDEIALLNDADPLNDPVETTPSQTIDESILQEAMNSNQIAEEALEEQQSQQEEQDFTFNALAPVFDPTLDTVEQNDIATILQPLDSTINNMTSSIGLSVTAGACALPYTWSLGGQTKNESVSFCEYDVPFTQMGAIIFGFSLLLSGYILIGART